MGTTLTGTTPQDTYEALIKVGDNGIITGSLKTLSDGEGHDTALALSTGAASVTGTLAVSGNAAFDTNTLFVDAAANEVGIGTATPLGKLDIIHGDTSPVGLQDVAIDALRIGRASGGVTAIRSAQFDAGGQPAAGDIQFLNLFFNGSTYNYYERMRITATGNVGIGTSAPSFKLTVDTGAVGVLADFTDGIAQTFRILSGSGFSAIDNTSGGAIALQTAGVERARITNDGLTFNGDTAAANALDDYEEGTWTPSVSAITGSYTSVTGQQGTYTKIGRQVTVQFYFIVSDKGSGTDGAQITNFPFTALGTPAGSSYVGGLYNTSTGILSSVNLGQGGATAVITKFDGTDGIGAGQGNAGSITYQV